MWLERRTDALCFLWPTPRRGWTLHLLREKRDGNAAAEAALAGETTRSLVPVLWVVRVDSTVDAGVADGLWGADAAEGGGREMNCLRCGRAVSSLHECENDPVRTATKEDVAVRRICLVSLGLAAYGLVTFLWWAWTR